MTSKNQQSKIEEEILKGIDKQLANEVYLSIDNDLDFSIERDYKAYDEIIRQYLFWRRWKKKLHLFRNGMHPMIYCIAPNSFKVTRLNWEKLRCSP